MLFDDVGFRDVANEVSRGVDKFLKRKKGLIKPIFQHRVMRGFEKI